VRELLWWALPGVMIAGPLRLLFTNGSEAPPWWSLLAIAPAVGFVLHQTVRSFFEARDNGFRSPHRGGLDVIIERGNLTPRADRGDIAYQVYEIVFYQRPDWQAARDHAHRCWEYIFLFRGTALGCLIGSGMGVLAAHRHFGLALLYLLALLPSAYVLWKKAEQTRAALDLFDRGLVLAHWPLYAAVLAEIERGVSHPSP